jgi:hypothetical protein
MKNNRFIIAVVMLLIFSNVGFAGDALKDQPLGDKEEHLFFPEGLEGCFYDDFDYDPVNEQIYVLLKTEGEAQTLLVYDLKGNLIASPKYDLIPGYKRKQMEFDEERAWSIENKEGKDYLFLNQEMHSEIPNVSTQDVNKFRVQGNQASYLFEKEEPFHRDYMYVTATNDPFALEDSIFYDTQHKIRGYDLSADGAEVFYLVRERINQDGIDEHKEIFIKRVNRSTNKEGSPIPVYSGRSCSGRDLYTTDEHIIVLYLDANDRGHVERYTYEGVLVDSVEVNFRITRIIEGPDGSTLYVQKSDPERPIPVTEEDEEDPIYSPCDDPVEMVQINWDAEKEVSLGSGPRPVIQEQTRAGSTIARFTDHQFGLIKMEEPETGIMDYKAPIRSKENLVKLQIPYCDIKAKLESGARNLMVEYQGQTLSFPMDLFQCDDMLASMPCQSDATIEIIMHTDEGGKVTYEIQLFVVEQTNAMTKVVHRKTLQ